MKARIILIGIFGFVFCLFGQMFFCKHKDSNQEKYSLANSDEFLLLDSRIIDKTENAKLGLGTVHKDSRNPLFKEDKPWEMRFDNLYPNILYDKEEKKFKCWYSPFIIDPGTMKVPLDQRDSVKYPAKRMGKREMGVCYAVSDDGINWEKPNLGIIEYDGSTKNNLVMREAHGAGVFKDFHASDPNQRYKMIFRKEKLAVAFSSDGLHWSEPYECEGLNVRGDTHNNAFWAPTLNKYVGITRTWERKKDYKFRQVAWTSSSDFMSWTEAKVVLEGLDRYLQVYALPVFFCKGVYLGLATIFNKKTDRTWTELAWSPDTSTWYRICPGTPFIPNSTEPGDYDWGCVYAAACPVFQKDKILLYYGGSDGPHTNWRKGYLCLASLRKDGFAGYEQIETGKPAVIITNPLKCKGRTISLNADVFDNGQILVTVLDTSKNVISKAKPIRSTVTDEKLMWTDSFSCNNQNEIIFKFELYNARLYSIKMN